MSRDFTIDPGVRLRWLRTITACGFIAGLILSPRLWLSSRSFPPAPVSDRLSLVPFPLDWAWFGLLLALLGAIIFARRPRAYLVVFVVLMAVYTLWDQARWTPWVYQYAAILAVLSFCRPGSADARRDAVLNSCRVIVATTYFWAGLQKVNVSFVRRGFPWLVSPFIGLPASVRGWLYPFGLGVAFLEACLAVALLTRPLRQVAVLAAMGMHALLLLLIGPFGHRWDSLVWPWNVVMPVSVGLLFWRDSDTPFRATLHHRSFFPHYAVLLLFAVMPALNFLDAWDANFSAALYSANTQHALVHVEEGVKAQLPAEAQKHLRRLAGGELILDVFRWSMSERNVEPYPEERTYKSVARRLCGLTRGSGLTLVVYGTPDRRSGQRSEVRYRCEDL